MSKKAILCFYNGNVENDIKVLEQFDSQGYEVHLFNDISEENISYGDMLNIIKSVLGVDFEDYEINIASNIKELVILSYKLYNQVFNSFIYLNNNSVSFNIKDKMYSDMYNSNLLHGNQCKLYLLQNEVIETQYYLLEDGIKKSDNQNKYRAIKYNGEIHLFEPPIEYNIISLDENEEKTYNVVYHIDLSFLENIISIFKLVASDLDYFVNNYSLFDKQSKEAFEYIIKCNKFEKAFVIHKFEALMEKENIYFKILVNSFLLKLTNNSIYSNNVIDLALNSDELDKNNRYFLMYQIIRHGFVNVGNQGWGDYLSLYNKILLEFKTELNEKLEFIPKGKRNKNLVVVFTSQFLTLAHGPTKTALDRCYTLAKKMNKSVIIMNTRDLMTTKGAIPYYDISMGAVSENYVNISEMEYLDLKIPYYQSECLMPEINEVRSVVNFIKKQKPYFAITIGGSNIAADICNDIIPVVTQATVMGIPLSDSNFYLPGKYLSEEEFSSFIKRGKLREQIIEGKFTFAFKQQENKFNRQQLELPVDKKLLLVVGGRLDDEVSDEFIECMKNTLEYNTHMVFAGSFNRYDDIIKGDLAFKENSTYLGFQQDMLAVAELCDIYVNPYRAGGQTSAAEAMYKGVPVVSLDYGDVSVCAEKYSTVKDFNEMSERIISLCNDEEYYNELSEKSKIRAIELLDTESELRRIIEIMEKSKLF